ncbi:MAG: hydroxylamine reductase [Deferribacteres bacterium]|nr:hydroxylamine reductase [Deferribacteres bacterium]
MSMFCYQCSEASKGVGCNIKGVCGKNDEVATLQDCLVYTLKGLSYVAIKAREKGIDAEEADLFVLEGLFATITNVNFDPERFVEYNKKALSLRDDLKSKVGNLSNAPDAVTWKSSLTKEDFLAKGTAVGVMSEENEDIRSLKELIIYGLKGVAAYADHAYVLKYKNSEITEFVEKALAETLRKDITADELISLTLKTGEIAVKTMALLDEANTTKYGNPEITEVYTGLYEGPGILVSGHDLLDLEELLIQTEGTGVKVYTHGEMLPAHAYPEFKKYKHLAGNFGTAWFNQTKEFPLFNGPILFTTNCIVPPKDEYKDRIFTTGLVGWPGVKHIPNAPQGKMKDFSPLIKMAKDLGGLTPTEGKKIVIGFAHNQVLSLADKVIEAVQSGAIKRFVVMAGCDGRLKEREYYTELAKRLPKDHVILTAGCAKYRYNMLELGDIGGIPRVLDAGQCNDSYSLAYIALKLKEVLGLEDINQLPISYDIAWYEQKAVCVLLALLYLGVKGIRLGPVLPAFLSPNVAKVLVENFDIKPIGSVEEDLEAIVAGK